MKLGLERLLAGKELWTTKELIRLGIFGAKSSVHRLVNNRCIEGFMTSDRRLVITRKSVIEYIMKLNLDDTSK